MKTILKKVSAAVMTLAVMTSAAVFDAQGALTAKAALSTSAAGGCDNDHSTMTAWTGGAFTLGGEYYLTGNVDLETTHIEIDQDITLCLNGNTIKAAPDSRIFYIDEGGSLTLCDCSGNNTGTFTDGSPVDRSDKDKDGRGGAVYLAKNSNFTMYGGTISGNTVKHQGGGVYVSSGAPC